MHDLIAGHDRVVHRVVEVREGELEGLHALLEPVTRRGDAGLRGVVHEAACEELVEQPEVASVQDFERNPLGSVLDIRDHQEITVGASTPPGRDPGGWAPGWHPPGSNFPGD